MVDLSPSLDAKRFELEMLYSRARSIEKGISDFIAMCAPLGGFVGSSVALAFNPNLTGDEYMELSAKLDAAAQRTNDRFMAVVDGLFSDLKKVNEQARKLSGEIYG